MIDKDCYIYVMDDVGKTKIGISTALEKRMLAYKTHNAKAVKVFERLLTSNAARKLESEVLKEFAEYQINPPRGEWLAVSCEQVVFFIKSKLNIQESLIRKSGHLMPVSKSMLSLQKQIRDLMDVEHPFQEELDRLQRAAWGFQRRELSTAQTARLEDLEEKIREHREKQQNLSNKARDLFAKTFDIGIPKSRLPEGCIILGDGNFGINWRHAKLKSDIVKEFFESSDLEFPFQDHVVNFYVVTHLSSGHPIALPYARVSMEYLGPKDHELAHQAFKQADDAGYVCTYHDKWSWHYPGDGERKSARTGLVLYESKSSKAQLIYDFNSSFRRWVIENSSSLVRIRKENPKEWKATIDFFSAICCAPDHQGSYKHFSEKVLKTWIFPKDDERDQDLGQFINARRVAINGYFFYDEDYHNLRWHDVCHYFSDLHNKWKASLEKDRVL